MTLFLGLVACGAVGCGSSEGGPSGSGAPTDAPPAAVDHVEVPTCGVGQMARAGSAGCVPVGPGAAPDGFDTAAPDWGFRAFLPKVQCNPDERARLGRVTCLPIEDCRNIFPPAGAKAVVTTDTQLQDAVAAAAPGDTIAIDGGTYLGLVIDKDINLVGRCAAKVTFLALGGGKAGIGVDGPYKVNVKSVKIKGFQFGIWAGSNARVTVDKSILEDNGGGAWVTHGALLDLSASLVSSTSAFTMDGLLAARDGHINVVDTELRNMHVGIDAYGKGSTVTGTHLVISERSKETSALVVSSDGADVAIDHSRIIATEKFIGGAKALDDRDPSGNLPARLRIFTSELQRSEPTDAAGFDVSGGSTLELTDSTLAFRARIAISAEEASNVSLVRTVIRPMSKNDASFGTVGAGIVINDGVHLTLDNSAIIGTAQSAVLASKECQIKITGSLIRDTWEFERVDLRKRMGTGQAISLSGNAVLDMTDSTMENNAGVSIWMGPEKSSVHLARAAVISTQSADKSNAMVGLYGLTGTLDITDSLFHGIPDTALGIGQVTGVVSGTVLSQSSVGWRLLGDSQVVDSKDDAAQPDAGQVLSRRNVLVDVAATQRDEQMTLGDCRCSTGR